MEKRGFRLRLGVVALLMIVIGSAQPVQAATAQDTFNLTVSPLPVNVATKPGVPVETAVRVQNSGTTAVKLKVSLMKFEADGTIGAPKLVDFASNDAFAEWVSFSKTSFVADPGVYNTIGVTIAPPASAAFGYYYAVVFSRDDGRQPIGPSQNRINGAVASLILLDVQTGGAKRQLEVSRFTASRKVFQYLPATFDITVKNTGNIHVIPTGNVFIKKAGSDDIIGTLRINDEQGNILPKSQRVFTTEWNDGFPKYQAKRQNNQVIADESGKPVRELSWDLQNISKIRLGHYNASMTLVYSDGTRDIPVEGEVSFWVVPWVPFLIVLAVVLLIGIGLWVMLRGVLRRVKKLNKV